MEALRKEYEKCDSAEFTQITHSASGSSGSGLMTKIVRDYEDVLSTSLIHTLTVIPESISDNVLELYNFVLTFPRLVWSSAMANFFQNKSLWKICTDVQQIKKPGISHVNDIVAKVATGVS